MKYTAEQVDYIRQDRYRTESKLIEAEGMGWLKGVLTGTILAIVIGALSCSGALANEYQTVRNVEGKSATDIMKVWKMTGTTANFKFMEPSADTLKFVAVTTCGKNWGVGLRMESDVLLEVKDNRYRITFERTRFEDNPAFGMADHKKGAKFLGVTQKKDSKQYVKCMEGIHSFLDSVDKKINNYSDF